MSAEYETYGELEQFLEAFGEEVALALAGVIAIVALIALLVIVVGYVLQSVGLYTIARNRGIRNPWLAWLPIGNYWIAGSIADQYQYVVNGQVKNRRKILLILSIAGMMIPYLVAAVSGLYLGLDESVSNFVALGGLGTVLELVASALELAIFIFWQIALYDLYSSCDPKNNVMFLVLGIFIGVTVPYFIFFNRKKELGMPPRKAVPEEPAWQPQTPPEEPWDNH